MTSNMKIINLNFATNVLTSGTVGEIVNEILELLLFQRNQIPIIYKTFKDYVEKWSEAPESMEMITPRQFHLEHQRRMATKTKDAISDMRDLIRKIFRNNVVKSIRFLFGATTFTPREAYTIHMPMESMTRKHYHEHHPIPLEHMNQTLISLVTCEELFAIFSSVMPATNVYLELELLDDPRTSRSAINAPNSIKVYSKDISQLPYSCKNIHFNLLHTRISPIDESESKCCKELEIFDDFVSSIEQVKISDVEDMNVAGSCEPEQETPAWWEANVTVRGFKEQPTQAFNIWNS